MLAHPSPRPPPPVPAAVAPAPLPRTGSAEARCRSGADSRTRLGLDSPQPRSRESAPRQAPDSANRVFPAARARGAGTFTSSLSSRRLVLSAARPSRLRPAGHEQERDSYQRVADVADVIGPRRLSLGASRRRRPRPHRHHTTAAKVRGSRLPKRARFAHTQTSFFQIWEYARTTALPTLRRPPRPRSAP